MSARDWEVTVSTVLTMSSKRKWGPTTAEVCTELADALGGSMLSEEDFEIGNSDCLEPENDT